MVNFITKLPVVAGKDAIIEETLVEGLVRLFQDNVQKLHRLPKTMISDKGL